MSFPLAIGMLFCGGGALSITMQSDASSLACCCLHPRSFPPLPSQCPFTHIVQSCNNVQGEPCDLKRFGQHLRNNYVPNTAIIDCTASDIPASNYLGWMNQGIHIITPNKKLGSGPLEQYKAVRKIQVGLVGSRICGSRYDLEAEVVFIASHRALRYQWISVHVVLLSLPVRIPLTWSPPCPLAPSLTCLTLFS